KLYPNAKLGIGPNVEDGFYYDFGNLRIKEEDFESIEKEMHAIIKKDIKFTMQKKTRKEAEKILKNEEFKLDLLKNIKDNEIYFYESGNFIDLCKGPHVSSTKEIKAFKLLKISSAYWKGNQGNEQLQRIYGTAFATEKELEGFLKLKEEAENRSHIKLGKDLGLFFLSPLVGPGLPLITPKGTIIREELQKFLRSEQLKHGYLPVTTPHIGRIDLYKKSGHYPYYKESMFEPMKCESVEYILKPMNCPHHIQVYQNNLRSYRELPLRLTEFGTVYRYEKSGELNGLTRVRMITQDDAHIFCSEGQVKSEILGVIDIVLNIFKVLNFASYRARFGTKDNSNKYIGSDEFWKKAEKDIEDALKEKKMKYDKAEGEAAFYGPKIDFIVKDVLGREWQLGTVQVDYNLPQRFELAYEGQDGKKHVPVMIHRAPFGSLERFMGILIEHFAGKFPLWLSPVQVKIITVNDRNNDFARSIEKKFKDNNIRVEVNDKAETLPGKVREAQLEQINYILTIGDKEVENKTLAVRTRSGKVTFGVNVNDFIKEILEKIQNKTID
ncbi:threonine--tRNA ligase, partial [Candidatus Woesearchaeota archaeon]|nr:threonine--tRNA ligase [Candidatus Woesearchaeota archaeon]